MKSKALTILILAILLCSKGYAQQIEYIGDGWFAIDRVYAERVAQQRDSLSWYLQAYEVQENALESCTETLYAADSIIIAKGHKINQYRLQVSQYEKIIDLHQTQINAYSATVKRLSIELETREKKAKAKKFWAVLGGIGGGFVIGTITGILIR
jgi:hypothetical protein